MNSKIKSSIRIIFPLLIGGIVGILIKDKIDYNILIKPPLAPPKIAFPIAWTIIYLLMGIAYNKLVKEKNLTALEKGIYYTQLGVNTLWSILFFVFHLRLLSCFWIILLDILVLIMIIVFYKKNKVSAYLNIFYFLWCLFATYLTIGIYILN